MLIANYGSDSGSDDESSSPPLKTAAKAAPPKPTTAPTPAPTTTKPKKRTGPVRITLGLPKAGREDDGDSIEPSRNDDIDSGEIEERNPKKPKLSTKGAGSSALLGMLPAPKRKLPTAAPTKSTLHVNKSMASKSTIKSAVDDDDDDDTEPAVAVGTSKSGLLLPSSISRAKAAQKNKEAAKEQTFDLFGLGTNPSSSSSSSTTSAPKPKPTSITITSAPDVKDFVPPPPTPNDLYPGYYQLPSGSWAAYDPVYYHTFFPEDGSLPKDYEQKDEVDDGRVGRHWDELDQMKRDGMVDIDVGAGLEAARREQERVARLTAPRGGQDAYDYKPIGQIKGLASQRHQLSSLLNDAYSNKEELENRIAQNKKNMRAAGQKYGF